MATLSCLVTTMPKRSESPVKISKKEDLYQDHSDDYDAVITSVQWPRWLVRMVDFERKTMRIPRSSWAQMAVMEKLRRLGYDVKKKMEK